MACSRLKPCPSNVGNFLYVFLTKFSENLEVIGLAKLDLLLDQFTNVLLYACQIHMILFMPKTVLALILIFQKFFFIRIKRQDLYLFLTIKYIFFQKSSWKELRAPKIVPVLLTHPVEHRLR